MFGIDIPTLINWITTGFIGLLFGVFTAWVTYRYGRKRDDISWEREKTKLQQQFEHDRELLKTQLEQRIQELEQQLAHQKGSQLREKLTEGIGNAGLVIKNMRCSEVRLSSKRSILTLLATALLVTVPLLYFASSPVNLIHVQIRPLQNYGTRILSTDTLVRSDKASKVFFDFRAYVENPSISKVRLDIRPSAEPNWYQQENFEVSSSFIFGTAQLGSLEFPVRQTEQYTFRLVAMDDTLLSEGQINVVVNQIAGAESWLIGGIGIFASLLSIISAILEIRKRQP